MFGSALPGEAPRSHLRQLGDRGIAHLSFALCTLHFALCTLHFANIGCRSVVATEFPFQRPVFLREYSSSTYTAVAYFLARFPLELLLALGQVRLVWLRPSTSQEYAERPRLLQVLITLILAYFLIDLRGNFAFYLLAYWMLNVAAASVATILGCALSDVKSVTVRNRLRPAPSSVPS